MTENEFHLFERIAISLEDISAVLHDMVKIMTNDSIKRG